MNRKQQYTRPDIQVVAIDTMSLMAGSGSDRETLPVGSGEPPTPDGDGNIYGD